jgi:hypothetical protein
VASGESVGSIAELYLGNILYALELAALSLETQQKPDDASFYRGIARKLAEAHGKRVAGSGSFHPLPATRYPQKLRKQIRARYVHAPDREDAQPPRGLVELLRQHRQVDRTFQTRRRQATHLAGPSDYR